MRSNVRPIVAHVASKKVVWFICIKANFICNMDLMKTILDKNMFDNQCVSYKSECHRHLTLSIGFQDRGKEESSKTVLVCQERFMCRQ